MIQFIFDTSVIIGGILFTLFSILIFTVHKKNARLSLYFSLIMFAIAIYTSYKKNATDIDIKQYPLSKDTLVAKKNYSLNTKPEDLKSRGINPLYFVHKKNINPTYGNIGLDSLNSVENRAYIIFSDCEPTSFNFHGEETNEIRIIKNVGKTPAKFIIHIGFFTAFEDSIDSAIAYDEKFIERHKIGGSILGANETASVVYHYGKLNVRDSIYFSTIPKFYIGGIIGYSDVFGNHHLTYYCIEAKFNSHEIKYYKKYNEIK